MRGLKLHWNTSKGAPIDAVVADCEKKNQCWCFSLEELMLIFPWEQTLVALVRLTLPVQRLIQFLIQKQTETFLFHSEQAKQKSCSIVPLQYLQKIIPSLTFLLASSDQSECSFSNEEVKRIAEQSLPLMLL